MSDYNSKEVDKSLLNNFTLSDYTPIYKGCKSLVCCCTGECKKVIGFIQPDGITKVYFQQNNKNELNENI